jgi:hypothetical protein
VSELEVQLRIQERLREAEYRRWAVMIRRPERRTRLDRVFGLRAPSLQSA